MKRKKKLRTVERIKQMINTDINDLHKVVELQGKTPTDIMMLIRFEENGHIHGIYPHEDIGKEMTRDAVEKYELDEEFVGSIDKEVALPISS